MSEEAKPANGAVPPKISLRNSESGTIPPAGAAPVTPGVAAKKATARIPLGTAEPTAAEPGVSTKTIRLTPLAAARPMSIAPAARPQATTSMAEAAKRQTSRIPLEVALAEEQAAGADNAPGAPKTIRIKRPNQPASVAVPTVKMAPAGEPASENEPNAQKSKTSRVDVAEAQAADAGQATQRKTIKIRRADGAATFKPVPRSVAVARLEAEAAEHAAEDAVKVNVAFPIMAAVALVILGILVVVLAAQAFPNLGWRLPGSVAL